MQKVTSHNPSPSYEPRYNKYGRAPNLSKFEDKSTEPVTDKLIHIWTLLLIDSTGQ